MNKGVVGSKTLENPRFQILSFYDVTKLPTTPLSVFCVFNNVTCFWSPMKKSQLWCSMTVTAAAAAGILGLHLVVGPARTAGSRVLNSMGLWIRIHIWRIRIYQFFSVLILIRLLFKCRSSFKNVSKKLPYEDFFS